MKETLIIVSSDDDNGFTVCAELPRKKKQQYETALKEWGSRNSEKGKCYQVWEAKTPMFEVKTREVTELLPVSDKALKAVK